MLLSFETKIPSPIKTNLAAFYHPDKSQVSTSNTPTFAMSHNVPEKQMAQVIEKTGGPVEFKEIPVQKPGPDEVLINIKYSGVCHTDLHAVNGDWPLPTKLPLVGGHEGAGVVVAKGDLVEDIEIGDHAGVKVSILISSMLAYPY